MSQDLVPDDLPYGDRQKRVEQMQSAGVPLESGQRVAPQVPPAVAGGGAPADLDALSEVEPAPPGEMVAPPLSRRDQMLQLADSAQSGVMRVVLQRLAEKL